MAQTRSSASSSYSTASPVSYDVFINHPGPLVQTNFASYIYHRLLSHGLQVFLSALDVGHPVPSQTEEAIRVAPVHVAIFSRAYAQSKGSLDELVLMLESRATILPVFYGVNPRDLRYTGIDNDGPFAEALRNHEQKKPRSTAKTIQNWRKALHNVSCISGLDLKAFNRDEDQLLDKLVEIVLKSLPKPELHVAEYPIGLADKMEEFEKTVLSQQQEEHLEAKVVGIVGVGGIGKTTLAKKIFNCKRSNYSVSSFIFDVRENAARRNLNFLQSRLIKDLKGPADVEINSLDEGKAILQRLLSSSHCLIVLDDVDDINQLYDFLPIKHVLHSESLILVTSRNKDVLKSAGIKESAVYQLRGLNKQCSIELFCLYAFSQPHTLPGFENLVDKFVSACYGLPLSLKVIGASVYGEDKYYWESQYEKISKALVPDEILRSLKISYDLLDPQEKQIFLDIACIFLGKDKDMAIRIWDGSGWQGVLALRNLQNKCLIEVYSDNKIRMHDHLRDMGRNIAAVERSMPRRLWPSNLHDLNNLLEQSSLRSASIMPTWECVHGVWDFLFKVICHIPWHNCLLSLKYIQEIPTEVRGIKMSPRSNFCDTGEEGLLPMDTGSGDGVLGISKLQLLEAEGDFVESILTCVRSPKLIWLSWNECPHSSLPSWIPMHDLRVLEVSGRDLKGLWQHKSQAPLQLRELNINAPLSLFPKSLVQLKHLEKFVLNHTEVEGVHLATLPQEFDYLQSLKHLELKRCYKLELLPDSFPNLINLQLIDLSCCKILKKLPDTFGNLTNLQSIGLSRCENLERLPDSFGNLTNLQQIDLSYCKKLEILPESFGNLINLQHINMSMCESLKMVPNFFGSTANLQYMDLSCCYELTMLPKSMGDLMQLKHLHLKGCLNLIIFNRSLGNITTLECLDLQDCLQMEMLPPQVGRQLSLKRLNLLGTRLKVLPSDVGYLINMEVLRLGSPLLEVLPPSLGNLTSLKELRLHGCKKLQFLPDSLGLLTQLTELNIVKCGIYDLPPSVMKMNSLKILRIQCCPLRELPFKEVENERKTGVLTEPRGQKALSELHSKGMIQLKELQLYRTEISEVFFPEGVCRNLQDLTIMCCDDLVEVGALPGTLVTLDLRYCNALKKIGGLYGLAYLETLDMRGCSNIQAEELPSLEKTLKSLKEVQTPLDSAEETATAASEEGVLPERKWLKMIFCEGEEILEIQDRSSVYSA